MNTKAFTLLAALVLILRLTSSAFAFEGLVQAEITQDSQTDNLLYTVGTNGLRVEMSDTNRPNAVDILDFTSGELTLLFPNNRSFVRLKAPDNRSASPPAGAPGMPDIPVPRPMSGASPVPAMPMMPPPAMEKIELQNKGRRTNILGFSCEQYEIRQRGQTMEIWATYQLFPFQPYFYAQPRRAGQRLLQERWAEAVKAQNLFPLLATLKSDNGPEHFRFEVKSVTPKKLTEDDAPLFQPPPNYRETRPRPF